MSFRPKCFYNEIPEAYTATGHIFPCCNIDNRFESRHNPLIKALYDEELKVENVKSKSDILLSKQWINFFQMLADGINIPNPCKTECGGNMLCHTYYEEAVKDDNDEIQIIKILK